MDKNMQLKVKIVDIKNNGACNCCSKGKLSENKKILQYAYTEVVRVEGKHQSMNFCKECFEVLTGMKYDEISREIG